MYGRDQDRLYTVGTVVVAAVTVLVLIFYAVVFARPNSPINPFPPDAPEVATVAAAPASRARRLIGPGEVRGDMAASFHRSRCPARPGGCRGWSGRALGGV